VLVPEVMNMCVPVMVNHGVPVRACVRACVRMCVQQETGQYTPVSSVCCPSIIPVVCAMGTSPTIGCGLVGFEGTEG
jgi:hypothetical protein